MPKITKKRIKELASLKQKKIRENKKLFIAEGEKIVSDLLESKAEIVTIVATKDWMLVNQNKLNSVIEFLEIGTNELSRLSFMTTPNKVIAYVKITEPHFDMKKLDNKLSLVLDDIQDPGNMGTIIRLSEWFGIENIVCSKNSADVYNPKVIQASMGAFLKVNLFYLDLEKFLNDFKKQSVLPVYGSFLDGKNIYTTTLRPTGIIIMGNESKGISKSIESFVDEKLTIPSFSLLQGRMNSLNVSVATAIICSEFRRNTKV